MSQFDWRDMVSSSMDHEAVMRRQVFKLHAQGVDPRAIALQFGMNDADIVALIYGPDIEGTV